MKINFDTVILDLKGNPVPAGEDNKPTTLGDISCIALQASFPDEQSLEGKEKFNRFKLAVKLSNGGEIDLSSEDVALIKKLIGKAFTNVVVGRAWEILDK